MLSHDPLWIHQSKVLLHNSDTDYFQLRPARYWADFLISVLLAFGLASVYLAMPLGSWQQIVAFPLAVFWLYRLGSLVHEVAHLAHGEMRGFKVTWNLVAGVMTLTPSPFFTRHHRDHHTCKYYGTATDPEYVANVCPGGSWRSVVRYLSQILLFPLLVWLRFVLSPISFLRPHWRRLVLQRASSLTLNWRYVRDVNDFDRWSITVVELLCFVRAAIIPIAIFAGLNPWIRIPQLYLLAVCTVALNQLRLLADHHLESNGDKLAFEDHILDSCNFVTKDFLTWLLFPFAIRYHALHHLFPSLPYHNLAAAHEHLTRHLPADSPYHTLCQPGWWSVAKNAFRGIEARTV
jgi:fatty acid desaturase